MKQLPALPKEKSYKGLKGDDFSMEDYENHFRT